MILAGDGAVRGTRCGPGRADGSDKRGRSMGDVEKVRLVWPAAYSIENNLLHTLPDHMTSFQKVTSPTDGDRVDVSN